MNQHILNLLEEIRTSSGETKTDALVCLWMLIEKNIGPNRNDPLHREVLPDLLFSITLEESDILEIVNRITIILGDDEISIPTRATLVNLLGKIPRIESFSAILSFLYEHGLKLSEESATSVVISISPQFLPESMHDEIKITLEQYQTNSSLLRLKGIHSEQFDHTLETALKNIKPYL